MRILLAAVVALGACDKGGASTSSGAGATTKRSASEMSAPKTTTALATDHVTLLQPEDVISQRMTDVDGFAATLKAVTTAIVSYDAGHAGVLPAELDAVVVARGSAVRVWLAAASGDVTIAELDQTLASMPGAPSDGGGTAT